ncbi:MAG: archaeosortase/exosortase family protein [Phycisphaerales bacterium]|nr:archaeosortase/exosortase family protein [Phycisphaerales bacterium]
MGRSNTRDSGDAVGRKDGPAGMSPTPGASPSGKRAVVGFVLWLAGMTIAFNAFFYLYLSHTGVFESYLNLNARASAAIMRMVGDDATADGTTIHTSRFSLAIKKGCDAIQASAFFVFIVLASPVAAGRVRRLPVLLAGIAALLLLNVVRIVSLYYTGVHLRKWFDMMHVDVWQPIFIFLPLCFWFVWVRGARRTTAGTDETR